MCSQQHIVHECFCCGVTAECDEFFAGIYTCDFCGEFIQFLHSTTDNNRGNDRLLFHIPGLRAYVKGIKERLEGNHTNFPNAYESVGEAVTSWQIAGIEERQRRSNNE